MDTQESGLKHRTYVHKVPDLPVQRASGHTIFQLCHAVKQIKTQILDFPDTEAVDDKFTFDDEQDCAEVRHALDELTNQHEAMLAASAADKQRLQEYDIVMSETQQTVDLYLSQFVAR